MSTTVGGAGVGVAVGVGVDVGMVVAVAVGVALGAGDITSASIPTALQHIRGSELSERVRPHRTRRNITIHIAATIAGG